MSTVTELSAYLVTQGIGTLGSTLFMGNVPMGATTAVSIGLVSSNTPIRSMGSVCSAPVADAPSVQVMVRDPDHAAGEAKAKAVIDALDFFSGSLSGTEYLLITLSYGPVYIGLDENNRHRWSLVFRVMKRRS
jgi:hypothetical protein